MRNDIVRVVADVLTQQPKAWERKRATGVVFIGGYKYIYLLVHVSTGTVVYVGETFDPYHRSSLREVGWRVSLDLFMLVVDRCEPQFARTLEEEYIRFFIEWNRKNNLLPLINCQDHGRKIYSFNKEQPTLFHSIEIKQQLCTLTKFREETKREKEAEQQRRVAEYSVWARGGRKYWVLAKVEQQNRVDERKRRYNEFFYQKEL